MSFEYIRFIQVTQRVNRITRHKSGDEIFTENEGCGGKKVAQ